MSQACERLIRKDFKYCIYIFRFYPQRLDLPWDDNSIRVRAQMPSIKRVGLIKSMQT